MRIRLAMCALWISCTGSPDSASHATSRNATCGDGIVEGLEQCDDGVANAEDGACTPNCTPATCGDGFVWKGVEDCDDGNRKGGDGCGPDCRRPQSRSLAEATVTLLGGAAGNGAGFSVAGVHDLDADGVDDVVVGSPGFGLERGAVHVLSGAVVASGILTEKRASFRGVEEGERAGSSIALSHDLDGERGVHVGAPYSRFEWEWDSDTPTGGVSYVLRGTLDRLSPQVIRRGYPDAEFGVGVAGADLTGLGPPYDMITGGPADSTTSDQAGTVSISFFTKVGGLDRVRLYGDLPQSRFGASVANAGDLDQSGRDSLLVGAPTRQIGGIRPGAVYVFAGLTAQGDISDATAFIQGLDHADEFGASVAGVGDVNGDGFDDIVVGAPAHQRAGAAFLFYGPVTGTLTAADADAVLLGDVPNGRAGALVNDAGDVNGDGLADIVIGAPAHDGAGTDAGAIYVVVGPVSGTVSLGNADVALLGEAAGDRAGHSADGVGDLDGDGFGDLIIGAPGHDGGGKDAGAAYIVYGS